MYTNRYSICRYIHVHIYIYMYIAHTHIYIYIYVYVYMGMFGIVAHELSWHGDGAGRAGDLLLVAAAADFDDDMDEARQDMHALHMLEVWSFYRYRYCYGYGHRYGYRSIYVDIVQALCRILFQPLMLAHHIECDSYRY